MTRGFSVGIIEDDVTLAGALSETFHASKLFSVDFEAHSKSEGERRLAQRVPDLCLVDLKLPDGSGADLIHQLRSRSADVKCLVLTVLADRASVVGALRAGADGYLVKDARGETLLAECRAVLDGDNPISPRVARYLLSYIRRPHASSEIGAELTDREIEVLRLFSRGLTYREVALAIGVSAHTVGDYVKSIYSQLRVNSRAEAVFEARQLGLIDPLD